MEAEPVATNFSSTGFSSRQRDEKEQVHVGVLIGDQPRGLRESHLLSKRVSIWFTCPAEASGEGLFRG